MNNEQNIDDIVKLLKASVNSEDNDDPADEEITKNTTKIQKP